MLLIEINYIVNDWEREREGEREGGRERERGRERESHLDLNNKFQFDVNSLSLNGRKVLQKSRLYP